MTPIEKMLTELADVVCLSRDPVDIRAAIKRAYDGGRIDGEMIGAMDAIAKMSSMAPLPPSVKS